MTKRGNGAKSTAIANAASLPTAAYTASASPHKGTLVAATVAEIFTVGLPERLVGNRTYDSDSLDNELPAADIEPIAMHRVYRFSPSRTDAHRITTSDIEILSVCSHA